MKLFLDSADIVEIERVDSYGILDGVTTNPSLIKKAAGARNSVPSKVGTDVPSSSGKNEVKDIERYIERILKLCKERPVSLEVIGDDYESMVREGRLLVEKFNGIADNVYVKIPVSDDGVRAIKTLSEDGVRVNCTLIFSPEQALLAAKAGAKFVSPFVGRVDDYIRKNAKMKFGKEDYFPSEGLEKDGKVLEDDGVISGVDLIRQIADLFFKEGIETEILAASIRNKRQLREVFMSGVGIATIPFGVVEGLILHPKSVEGMKKFSEDVIPEYAEIFKLNKGGKNNV